MAEARQRAEALHGNRAQLERAARDAAPNPDFLAALRGSAVGIIAEVKRASPSGGTINSRIRAGRLAAAFERAGASAISVLTEPASFGGSAADLSEAAGSVRIPVLRKDFHVDPAQLFEARARGAAAALLIVRALNVQLLQELVRLALDLQLEPLVEVRTESELSVALAAGARVVGVNRRDLETLIVDPDLVSRLVPLIPTGVLAVAESGYSSRADVESASEAGADAVLIGSVLSAAAEPEAAVVRLKGVRRRPEKRGQKP